MDKKAVANKLLEILAALAVGGVLAAMNLTPLVVAGGLWSRSSLCSYGRTHCINLDGGAECCLFSP